MTFDQSSWQLHNSKVYNIAGDLHLTEQSGPREFGEALTELRSRLGALEGIPEDERAAVDEELADLAAAAEADSAEEADDSDDGAAAGDVIAGRLTRLGNRLRALGGTATAAAELGTSLDSLAHWADQYI